MTMIIAVGYTTRPRDMTGVPQPVVKAPGNYGAEAAAKYVATQQEKFLSCCGEVPHYGELATLAMADFANKRVFEPLVANVKPKKDKDRQVVASLEVQAGKWLMEKWSQAFPAGMGQQPKPPHVIFVGFDMRTFLKLLGLRCAEEDVPLPPCLWYGNSEHRDIGKAMTGEDDWQNLPAALFRLGHNPAHQPGQDAQRDLEVTTYALKQLGMLR